MTDNIYQPPNADLSLNDETEVSNGGSLETAVRGEYIVEFGAILREAWRLTKGNKGVIWLAMIVVALLFFVAKFGLGMLGIPDGQAEIASGEFIYGFGLSVFNGFLLSPLTAPLMAGFTLLCIKRVSYIPVSLNELFAYFDKLLNLIVLSILMTVLIYIGLALLVLPGIYLTVAYAFAVPLMIDKKLSPWQSLEASRRAVTHHWFPIFGIGIVLYLIFMFSALTVIGLIWSLPLCILAYSLLYRTIFGVSNDTDVVTKN